MEETYIGTEDYLDVLKLLTAALEPDAPMDPKLYINSAITLLTGPITHAQRAIVEDYRKNKEYLPKKEIIIY